MAGSKQSPPKASPTGLTVHRKSRMLEIGFDDGQTFTLPFELLRVYSPSAEVRGHGPGQETLQTGKREVDMTALEPVGNYAVQPHFSDAHDTGIFSWEYLHWLGENQPSLWADYMARLQAAGYEGESGRDVVAFAKSTGAGKSCGSKS
ncbi:DUF971 domain-containing protein [Actimicrobium antarcticum]|uniref:DUF971 domain-containing protein n=1 Tax=Actimicrobium antarcticum TaxID=1051899 RepID=A0ABP7T9G0_9BURK